MQRTDRWVHYEVSCLVKVADDYWVTHIFRLSVNLSIDNSVWPIVLLAVVGFSCGVRNVRNFLFRILRKRAEGIVQMSISVWLKDNTRLFFYQSTKSGGKTDPFLHSERANRGKWESGLHFPPKQRNDYLFETFFQDLSVFSYICLNKETNVRRQ